jgi:hypothetical protein
VQSPGWKLLVKEWMLPCIQQATEQLDRPGNQSWHQDYQRGVKAILKSMIEIAYKAAELPTPFERSTLTLLALFDDTKVEQIEVQDSDTLSVLSNNIPEPVRRSQRVSHPV